MSSFNATSNKNSGYIYTVPAENTIYEQVISSDMQLNTHFRIYFRRLQWRRCRRQKKGFYWQGFGTWFDLGLTYYPKKNIQFTASILDVGFIKHSKDVETFTYKVL
jgi:hypothetical protein